MASAAAKPELDAKGNPIRAVSRTLTAERRDKLLMLQRREQMKDVLVEKFKRSNVQCSDSLIDKEVTNFVKKAKVTEANLNRLERRIRHHAKEEKDGEDCNSDGTEAEELGSVPDDVVSRYSQHSVAASQVSRLSDKSATTTLSAILAQGKNPNDYDWGRLDDYAIFLHEQDGNRAKQVEKSVQSNLKQHLDVQVVDRQRQKQRLVDDEKKYYDNLLIELENWKLAEEEKKEVFQKKIMAEKKSRDEQYYADQKKKAEEAAKLRLEEEQQVKQVVEELEQEKAALEAKKEKEKKAILKVFKENMIEKQQREKAAAEARQRDLEEQINNQRLQEEKAEKRAQEAAERDAHQKEMIALMKDEMTQQAEAAGKEDAIRAKAQREEAEQRASAIDTLKNQKLKEMRHETQNFLFQQMAEKESRNAEKETIKNLQAAVYKADEEEYNEMEAKKVVDRKERNKKNRAELEKQIEARKGIKKKAMSSSEISMNIDLINVVEQTLKERDQMIKQQKEEAMRRAQLEE